ncbi:SIMPL domain-containing protein [Pasteurella sp. PK-2025]|uniref:SIMPL domain-containing protein n=1 Tax=Pasteurella sp. PK-2025 TaxID=3413133 RepID=UPI003C78A35A
MTLKQMIWLFLALPLTLQAQGADVINNQVKFVAEVAKEIERDEMRVALYWQEEGKDAEALNQSLVERINHALALIKKQQAVEILSQQRYTQVRYGKDGKQNGWVDRVEFLLKSQDIPALSKLVSALNDDLKIEGLYATVSQERLARVEKEMTAEVVQKFEQKAQLIQSLMKAKGYRLIELDFAPQALMGETRNYAVSMKGGDQFYGISSHDEMRLEVGKTTLKSVVQAKIELIND